MDDNGGGGRGAEAGGGLKGERGGGREREDKTKT